MSSGLTNSEPEGVFVLPTSLGQERFWSLDRLSPGNPTWMVPVRFRLQGALNPEWVRRAFNEIVQRHESLRTTFTIADGKLAQVIKPSLKIEVPATDLRHLPKPERDAVVDKLSFQEARRGFDLALGPLFRAGLLRVGDDEHVLMVTPHHSVADYWSIGLISNELGTCYEAYSRGQDPVLPDLAIQYGDFAVWQREQADGPIVQNELAYWERQLQNLPLVDFPTDHPRPNFPTYDATIISILLPLKLTDAMKAIANRAGATFFNTMLAGLGMVLHGSTGQTDFGVATQVAGRSSVELEPLIGLFINTVILRLDLTADPSFLQLLDRVQTVGMEALANQNIRFEQVLRELRSRDYPSHHTLFRVNFICQRDPVKPLEFSGIKLTVIPSKSQGALYDLNIFLVLRTEGWRLACEYNTDLFEAATINRLLARYRKMLESIVDDPNLRLSQLTSPEGVPPEVNNVLASSAAMKPPGGSSRADSEHPQSLGASSSAQADTPERAPHPGASFANVAAGKPCVMPASAAQRRFWVLEELAPGNPALHMRACVRLTGALSHPTLDKSLQFLVARHEILHTTFKKSNGEPVQVIAPSGNISFANSSLEEIAEADREATLQEAIRAEASAPFDLARGPLIRARLFRFHPLEHVLIITTHHILTDGWSQSVIQRDLWAIYEALAEEREALLPPLTIQYADFVDWQQKWLASDSAREQIEFWQKQLGGPLPVLDLSISPLPGNRAAAQSPMETLLLPEDLVRSLKSLSQSQDATMFMVMLTGYAALLHRYTDQEDILIGSPVANRTAETEPLIGPFAGPVALRLNLSGDPTLRELLGQVRDVTLNALSHADLPFEVLLEKLDVRSVHGRNPLSQLYFFYQTAFLQPRRLPGLTVTPMPDFGLGTHFELQMGLLERREGVRAQLEYNPDLFEAATVKEILNRYEVVLRAFAADPERRLSDLPLSMRPRPERVPLASPSRFESSPARNETEKELTNIWEDLLRVRPIGLHQNYFELGGNSLLAVGLFASIEKVFNVNLPLSTLIKAPTIAGLARRIQSSGPNNGWSPLVEIQPGGTRPKFFCVHGGGGNVLIYRDLSRHLGSDQPLYGLQAQGLDGKQPLLTRIEEMAALYVEEIQKVQPRGPYFLGGYCMGGTIALEMAQQLCAQGEEVALLAMFDTINWSMLSPGTIRKKIYYEVQRWEFHSLNFLLLGFKDKLAFLQGKLGVLRSRLAVWKGMLPGRLAGAQGGGKSRPRLLARIWKTNDQASLDYVARPYPGVITDFRPLKQYERYNEPGVHWDELVGARQEIVTLRVYPAGMLVEPFVRDLAAALRMSIDKVARVASVEGSHQVLYGLSSPRGAMTPRLPGVTPPL